MRDYGSVSPQFWIGQTGKALRGNMPAQILALYLMTSPHANMIGVFYCPIDYMAKETGMTLEGASEALRSLIEADFCRFDHASEEVFVLRMAAFQVGDQLDPKDNRCKGVAKELEKVTSSQLRQGFRANYAVPFNLPLPGPQAPQTDSPSEAPLDPLRSQKQNQKQEQDRKDTPPAKLPTCPAQSLVDLYHEVLPELPRVKLMPAKRERALKAFWQFVLTSKKTDGQPRANDAAEAVGWIRQFFERARGNDFLMGRTPRTGEHANWQCDLDFLLTDKGRIQVIEKTKETA